jgi:hypothetical protein
MASSTGITFLSMSAPTAAPVVATRTALRRIGVGDLGRAGPAGLAGDAGARRPGSQGRCGAAHQRPRDRGLTLGRARGKVNAR